MGDRYRSREIAKLDFVAHKSMAKHVFNPNSRHFWFERMRNAWAAYHAGALWVGHPVSVGRVIIQATDENARLRAEVGALRLELGDRDEVLQGLRAEVERHEADLRDAAGDLPVEVPRPGTEAAKLLRANRLLRAEVERLRMIQDQLRQWLHKCGNESVAEGCDASVVAYSRVLAEMDALAREDGEG